MPKTEKEPNYAELRTKLIEENKLKLTAVFVPKSQSRNRDEKNLSLNWKVTLWKGDREVITTDYSQGIAHLPCYDFSLGLYTIYNKYLTATCERGKYCGLAQKKIMDFHYSSNNDVDPRVFSSNWSKPIPAPKIEDVLYSLVLDSDVLDSPNYEDWASNFGYDPDSISGDKIYRACLQIALTMRSHLGDKLLSELRDVFQDY